MRVQRRPGREHRLLPLRGWRFQSMNFGRARATARCSGSETLAAAAGLGCIGIMEAQPPSEAFVHEIEGSALNVRQARRVDNNANAPALEDRIVVANLYRVVDTVGKSRAAG